VCHAINRANHQTDAGCLRQFHARRVKFTCRRMIGINSGTGAITLRTTHGVLRASGVVSEDSITLSPELMTTGCGYFGFQLLNSGL
jgi:hypothetical protein